MDEPPAAEDGVWRQAPLVGQPVSILADEALKRRHGRPLVDRNPSGPQVCGVTLAAGGRRRSPRNHDRNSVTFAAVTASAEIASRSIHRPRCPNVPNKTSTPERVYPRSSNQAR